MPLPQLVQASAERIFRRYCREKALPCSCACADLRLNFSLRDDSVTLFLERQSFPSAAKGPTRPVAQFRYSHDLGQWTLYYPDPHREWLFYLNAGPSLNLDRLLIHLDRDPFGFFWE